MDLLSTLIHVWKELMPHSTGLGRDVVPISENEPQHNLLANQA